MQRGRYPVLRSNEVATLDWLQGEYLGKVVFQGDHAKVSQEIIACRQLEQHLRDGSLRWALELRSPSTLYADVIELNGADDSVKLPNAEIDDVIYAIPGALAIKSIELDPVDGLASLWDGASIEVPVGTWLVRGSIYSSKNQVQSLIAFDVDERLPPGTMRIAEPSGPDGLQFIVYLAPNISPRFNDRNILHAALVGVFSKLPSVAAEVEADTGAGRQLASIQKKLEENNINSWEDHDDYDPALAATGFEPFTNSQILDDQQ